MTRATAVTYAPKPKGNNVAGKLTFMDDVTEGSLVIFPEANPLTPWERA